MDREIAMYGMTVEDIEDTFMNGITARLCGLEMVVMGLLSDCQEMNEHNGYKEVVRKNLNIAKYILSKMHDQKEVA